MNNILKKYLEFEINILLFNHLSCKVIVTKGNESYEKGTLHSLNCFRMNYFLAIT